MTGSVAYRDGPRLGTAPEWESGVRAPSMPETNRMTIQPGGLLRCAMTSVPAGSVFERITNNGRTSG